MEVGIQKIPQDYEPRKVNPRAHAECSRVNKLTSFFMAGTWMVKSYQPDVGYAPSN